LPWKKNAMLKTVRAVGVALAIPLVCPAAAIAQEATKFIVAHVSADKAQTQRTSAGGARFAATQSKRGYYDAYRSFDLNNSRTNGRRTGWKTAGGYYGDWRQSFSPYWALEVTTELVATAPAYYYYGVGHGDPYGYGAPVNDAIVVYCLQVFNSRDSAPGRYTGRNGYPHQCQ
jgi:hypothetical protein